MKRLLLIAVPLILVLAASEGLSQEALERLERRLADEEAAAAEGDEQPAPRAAAEPGYLGAVADDRQDRGQGVRIVEVVPGGPAEKAGLADGDLVTAIDGLAVRSMADVAGALQASSPGQRLEVTIDREGESRTIEVTLGLRPPPGERRFDDFGRIPEEGEVPAPGGKLPGEPEGQTLGITAGPVTEESRRRLRLPDATGALVTEVLVGSPADRAGIPLGAVIVAANGQEVDRPADLGEIVRESERGRSLSLDYLVRGKRIRAMVELDSEEPVGPALLPEDADSESRVEALERRIRELEDRVEALEQSLREARSEE
jgi:S1-C subfamily serine protease